METYKIEPLVHQCLHGYSDGHRMLASSLNNFSPSVKRLLLEMSDISGPSMLRGFESYITGYPLVETPYYALAKTWYAEEMERPGCVWTHTLLLPTQAVRNFESISWIFNYFDRPTNIDPSNFSKYATPMQFSSKANFNKLPVLNVQAAPIRQDTLAFLINSLYENNMDIPVFVSTNSVEALEAITIRIWLTQHASLREYFSFCTGSLSPRKINNRLLDLQFVPEKVLRTVTREKEKIITVDISQDPIDLNAIPNWAYRLSADILQNKVEPILSFIHKNDIDLDKDRNVFVKLLNLFYLHEQTLSRSSIHDLVIYISDIFPNQNEAVALKSNLITSPDLFGKNNTNELHIILSCLLTHANISPFLCLKEAISELGRTFLFPVEHHRISFIQQIAAEPINELGVSFLEGIAYSATIDILLLFSTNTKTLIGPFLEFNPKLAAEQKLWNSFSDISKELIDHISVSQNLTETTMAEILDTLIYLEHLALIEYFNVRLKGKPLPYFLDLIKNDDNRVPKLYGLIFKLVGQYQSLFIFWLSNNIQFLNTAILDLITKTIDPLEPDVLIAGTEIWVQILDYVKLNTDNNNCVAFAKFILPLALVINNVDSKKLIGFAAPIVNDILAKDSLDYTTWRRLDGLLPRLPWYRSWDKCKRLHLGLQERGI